MANEKSAKNLAQALAVTPEQMAALLLLGYSYYENGRYGEAKDVFEGVQLLDASNPYPNAILGSIHQRQRNYEEAIAWYSRALEIFDKDINSLANRGECYLNVSKFTEAAGDFNSAILLDPQKKHPAANRARLLVALTLEGLKLAKEKGKEAVLEAQRRIEQQLSI